MSEDGASHEVRSPCLHCPATITGAGKTLDDAEADLVNQKKLHAWKCSGRRSV